MLSYKEYFLEIKSNEYLKSFLDDGSRQVGDEKIITINDSVKLRKDNFGSFRFVKYDNEIPIGVLQVVSTKKKIGHVANVYVKSEYRRKGIATELLNHAKKLFDKELTFSNDLSGDGENFLNSIDK